MLNAPPKVSAMTIWNGSRYVIVDGKLYLATDSESATAMRPHLVLREVRVTLIDD